jgi:hypothetical protein
LAWRAGRKAVITERRQTPPAGIKVIMANQEAGLDVLKTPGISDAGVRIGM